MVAVQRSNINNQKSKRDMEMEFTIAKPREIVGTGRIGLVRTSANNLLERFGMPHNQIPDSKESEWRAPLDQKVRFEWMFKSVDGKTVITIYDYKDRTPFRDIDEWHVGGKGDREKIKKFFKLYLPSGTLEVDK